LRVYASKPSTLDSGVDSRLNVDDDGAPHLDRDSILGCGPEFRTPDAAENGLVDTGPGSDPLLQLRVRDRAVLVD
jgi:hypothetical protein